MVMTKAKLLRSLDRERLKAEIRQAEQQFSGEIQVSISPVFWGDVRKAAGKAFLRMQSNTATDGNAVLFFVVPARRTFVVLGGSGIHAKVGQQFWQQISDQLSAGFREGDFTNSLILAIAAVGKAAA
jgi:uncharacterized membrane protein